MSPRILLGSGGRSSISRTCWSEKDRTGIAWVHMPRCINTIKRGEDQGTNTTRYERPGPTPALCTGTSTPTASGRPDPAPRGSRLLCARMRIKKDGTRNEEEKRITRRRPRRDNEAEKIRRERRPIEVFGWSYGTMTPPRGEKPPVIKTQEAGADRGNALQQRPPRTPWGVWKIRRIRTAPGLWGDAGRLKAFLLRSWLPTIAGGIFPSVLSVNRLSTDSEQYGLATCESGRAIRPLARVGHGSTFLSPHYLSARATNNEVGQLITYLELMTEGVYRKIRKGQKRRLAADVVGAHPAGKLPPVGQVCELTRWRQASSGVAQFAVGAYRAHRIYVVKVEGQTGLRIP
ncbi:hypothetical protein BJY52DRAFT_1356302 [Lactarius psammicola]|nr:hypothetical protein BJY52DRAFT_1356302 [Lactarius psammicola]